MQKIIIKEINIIKPKIIVLCGIGLSNTFSGVLKKCECKFTIIEMPHPAARMNTKSMLGKLKQKLDEKSEQ